MADKLWMRDELETIFGVPAITGELPLSAGGVSIDTRTLAPGDIFIAIKGDRTDGHNYVEQAFAAGAGIAIVGQDYQGAEPGALIRVPDTLEAMCELGRAARVRSEARIVAVTGSVGKTSTKEMLRLMLGRLGRVHASDKSYNNHWGVPLSLARQPRNADFAVFEIGMNHAGEIVPLTGMVRPHAAIITTIAPVHIEFFASIEAIADAKAEIFQGIEPGGAAILNQDNEQFSRLARAAKEQGIEQIISFGRDEKAVVRLRDIAAMPPGSQVEADCFGEMLNYRIGAPGEHLAMNSLAAVAAVKILGGNVKQAVSALAGFGAPQGRGAQSVHDMGQGQFRLIDEAYNANPASMQAAFAVLGGLPGDQARRRIAVLGDMLELGDKADALHAELAHGVETARIDKVYCCGPHMAALFEALPEARRGGWTNTSDMLKQILLSDIQAGDAIMIKGSLGSRMGQIVEAIKDQFPKHAAADQLTAT